MNHAALVTNKIGMENGAQRRKFFTDHINAKHPDPSGWPDETVLSRRKCMVAFFGPGLFVGRVAARR